MVLIDVSIVVINDAVSVLIFDDVAIMDVARADKVVLVVVVTGVWPVSGHCPLNNNTAPAGHDTPIWQLPDWLVLS